MRLWNTVVFKKKAVGITYSECVFETLVDQNAKVMHHIILSSVTSSALRNFSVLSHKRHNFRGEWGLLNVKCVFWFSLQRLSQILFILSRTERVITINVLTPSRKVPVIIVRFQWNFNLLNRFPKILKYQISWKSFQWKPSCSMRTDRHDEANSRFSQFCERA